MCTCGSRLLIFRSTSILPSGPRHRSCWRSYSDAWLANMVQSMESTGLRFRCLFILLPSSCSPARLPAKVMELLCMRLDVGFLHISSNPSVPCEMGV
jgi:hypothetical protein